MVSGERALRKLGRRYGFDLERTRGGHYRLRSATGEVVIAAASPSCSRHFKNTEADLRRARRPAKKPAT
jgi:predicted RNA binding protein YcfA (HicA-like mRNA interferase family)